MPHTICRILLIVTHVAAAGLASATASPLWIDLGPTNSAGGLSVPSGGDGENIPATVGDSPCRELAGPKALYLYVRIEDPAWRKPAPRDLYATFEVFDGGFAFLRLQYDKADSNPNLSSKYAASPDTALLTGSGKWRRIHFALPAARLAGGQNSDADLRLNAPGAAVRRIELSDARPEGHGASASSVDQGALDAIRARRPPGMQLTFGNDANPVQAALYRALSVTSVESYVDWAGVEPRRQDEWDWTEWDEQVRVLREAGLKWVPFLIAGPAYATPLWFHGGPESAYYRCLEHGQWSKVQTLFNPALRPHIDRFLAAFAARYRDSGIIESVLLGVTGIFGESIYPAGHSDGGWTGRLTGPYHNHLGWWAGDPLAIAAFRDAMRHEYRDISALNRAWGARHASFDAISTFLPENAPSDRARYDMAEWYQRAMTDWSSFWVQTTRKHFPETEIYLCTGGAGDPVLGADFTAQAKAIAPHRAGIRITNEGSDYARNFTLVREVLTATSLYGTFAGFEPASSVNAQGIIARIYGATASGARQLHDYSPNVLNPEAMASFRANIAHLAPRRPRIDAALYASRESWAIDGPVRARWHEHAHRLRDIIDYHIVTRQSVEDRALDGLRVLVMTECPALEPKAATAIEAWVNSGGVLLAATRRDERIGARLFDQTAWRDRLFAKTDPARPVPLDPHLIGQAPDHWSVHIGAAEDRDWIFGDWHSPESATEWKDAPSPKRRWTGARAGVYLPARPNAPHSLRLYAYLSGHSTRGASPEDNVIRLNGHVIGHLKRTQPGTDAFEIPADVVGPDPIARLEFSIKTWKPSHHGSADDRDLGLMVHRVEWVRKGAKPSPRATAEPPAIEFRPSAEAIRPLVRRVGAGHTVLLAGLAEEPTQLARALAAILAHPRDYLPDAPPLSPIDGRIDDRYATAFADGVLWFDAKTAQIRWAPAP